MTTWLFIDRLPHAVTAEELKSHLAQFGTVRRVLIFPRSKKISSVAAYAEMATVEETERAARALKESKFLGPEVRTYLIRRGPPSRKLKNTGR